jgi:CxxC motif-containing protein
LNETKTITCINCPLGCSVSVAPGETAPVVSGNECRRGEEYALQEYRDPRRILTGTVVINGAFIPRLPVKTAAAIAKADLTPAARALDKIAVQPPVRCGDVIADDFFGSALLATRDLEAE